MPEKQPILDASLEGGDTVVRPTGTPPAPEATPGPLYAGRYVLERMVGRGGMGTVYQARDSLVGDVVALKTLELGGEAGPDALERFRREVRLARRISHAFVARMHDLGSHEGQAFLTMEYVEGEDVRALLAREKVLPAPRAARLALAVCEGLAAAHAAGVVHRDLKPANVLVERGGRVVLTDFGIARAVAGELAARTQGAVGTPLYMAPEQVSGDAVDARADLYAVGLLLHELLTGEPAFSGDTPWAAALARLRQPPPDLRQRPTIPVALAEVVHRCLARAPEERPASALEVASALREWLHGVGEPTSPTPLVSGPVTAVPAAPLTASSPRTSTPGVKVGVALLPLRFQGPRDSEFLGDSLTEVLIDQLSRVRGLRVPGGGVMERFRQERDPRTVGRELGVELVVDGTVQAAGAAVRVSIRLLEAESGTQLWSERFEYGSSDAFELQDRLCPRITEELRCELVLAAWSTRVPPEALSLYRQAHAQTFGFAGSSVEVPLELVERCLELAPDFLPAIALRAVASLRVRFMGRKDDGRNWSEEGRTQVERALRLAPEQCATHLARAMLAAQEDDWRTAVAALRTSLELAPTHAASLQYLGTMQCEAGRADEGLVRLRLAYDISPSQSAALHELARCNALRGQLEDYQWAMERLSRSPLHRLPALMLRTRVSAWTGDLEEVRRCLEALSDATEPQAVSTRGYAAVVLGVEEPSDFLALLDDWLVGSNSPRLCSLLCQVATEVLCLIGQPEQALRYFQRAADAALIDLEWIERCPALQPLRSLPGFLEGKRKVRARVEAIWNG